MDRSEAHDVLRRHLEKFKVRSYKELVELIDKPQFSSVTTENGVSYNVEVRIRWEGRPGTDLRVIGLIDDKSFLGAVLPVTEDFIVTPEGKLFE